jgi:hypothetical protein
METIFRPKKSYRNLGILCLLFFLGMTVFALCLVVSNGGGILAALLLVGFWGFWVILSVMTLLAYYRESLTVEDGRIAQTGIFRKREMSISEVINVRWRIVPVGGAVVLRSASQKIKVTFDNFELEQRLWLIRFFRRSLSPSIQRDWERFCLRNALSLSKFLTDDPLQAGEILLTRRRWDRFFSVLTVLTLAAGIVSAWCFRSFPPLAIPVPIVAIWLMMRFTTPRQGMRCERISATPEKGFLLFLLVWGAIGLATISWLGDRHRGLAIGLMILWAAVLLFQAVRVGRRREAARDAVAPSAAEEWERLEETDSSSA